MPRHVQIVRTCENHPDVPATDDELPPVTWGSGRARVIDVCDECWQLIVEPFMSLLMKGSELSQQPQVPTTGTARRTARLMVGGDRACPFAENEGCIYTWDDTPAGRQRLSAHLRKGHGTSIRRLREEGATI